LTAASIALQPGKIFRHHHEMNINGRVAGLNRQIDLQ